MRGWRLVGRVVRWRGDLEIRVGFADGRGVGALPVAGDILGVSPFLEGPLRSGLARMPRIGPAPDWTGITAACDGDYVFVATAIGENAFRPAEAI